MRSDIYIRPLPFVVAILVTLFLIKFLNIPLPLAITTSQVSSELSVVGEGKVDVTPDTAYVDIGVTIEKVATADEAQSKLRDQNNKIIAAMKAIGITTENIKTSNFSISPNYIYDGGKNKTDGFNGNASVTVKTDKVELAGKVIEEATKAGATNVGGARFVVDKPEVYREQARDKAIANAKEQAAKIAGSLGITLGRVTNIVESSAGGFPQPIYAEKLMALDARASGSGQTPNLEPGTQTVSTTVTLYFEKR
jgi:uncharacterized protein YggE